ncbi:MAG: glycosyltransferase [Candidatus Magasanikbacteria bacterium]|jgi:glycosyltransferase involved in cell wall biosynthesis
MPNKIIILHDYFLYKGGGERLVISMAKILNADIATAFIAKDAFDPRGQISGRVIELYREKSWSRVPGFRYLQVQLSFLLKTGFLKNYDTVIYSGDCLTALLRARHAKNIAYMHTPPRHLFDCYSEKLRSYSWWKKILFVPFAGFNRWRFRTLSKHFDKIITNSKNTQARIKKFLGLESIVVYPPCDTLPFKNLSQGDYFFSWARLYSVKRIDLIAQAFTQMPDKKLIIASGGPELQKIQKMAEGHDNIKIVGWISDDELLQYLGKCLATIYIPVREDFGMSPVESMTAGKPVIGVAEGGLLEIIEDQKNGVMLPADPTENDLIQAVDELTPAKALAMEQNCYATARKFTEAEFARKVREEIYKLRSRAV